MTTEEAIRILNEMLSKTAYGGSSELGGLAVKKAVEALRRQEGPVVQCVPFEPVGVPVDKVVSANIPDKKEEPVSDDLEKAAKHYLYSNILYDDVYVGNPTDKDCVEMFKAGARWQKEKDDEERVLTYKHGFKDCKEHIKEVLLSEVLPCFMYGGEADEVVAKLDEVLN